MVIAGARIGFYHVISYGLHYKTSHFRVKKDVWWGLTMDVKRRSYWRKK